MFRSELVPMADTSGKYWLYFNCKELCRTDGAISERVTDIMPDSDWLGLGPKSEPQDLVVNGSWLFFSADDGGDQIDNTEDDGFVGRELFKSNGVTTMLAGNICRDEPCDSNPNHLTVMNGKVYFSADDHKVGRELWSSDGTTDGTILLKDINPGVAPSEPENLIVFKQRLYFTADDGESGVELYSTDGTSLDTRLVANINYAGSSSPQDFVILGQWLYFSADSGEDLGCLERCCHELQDLAR